MPHQDFTSKQISHRLPSVAGIPVQTGLRSGKPLGDRVADFTHLTGLDHLAHLYTEISGKDCGCKARQEYLNKLVPEFL